MVREFDRSQNGAFHSFWDADEEWIEKKQKMHELIKAHNVKLERCALSRGVYDVVGR